MRFALVVAILATLVPSYLCISLPEFDHDLPGWNGEASGLHGDEQGDIDWSGERIQLSWAPRAYLLKRFLTDAECDHLISLSEPYMRNSTVANSQTGQSMASEVRTSTGTFLAKGRDAIVAAVEKRVAQASMIPEENQEAMQILHYVNGQKYEPHHDFFHDKVNQAQNRGGQRIATVLMYLTTPDEGGETVFPNAAEKIAGDEWSECAKRGLAVKATRGNALLFFSLHPDGTEDPTSLHGSCPTTKGEKWSATKWIRVGKRAG
eukprot:jgi/Ulvmu1/5835/UM025_0093.1